VVALTANGVSCAKNSTDMNEKPTFEGVSEQKTHSVASSTPKWAFPLEYTAAVLAILAVTSYVILRLAFGQFYGGLGIDPEDVGLGYADTVADSVEYVIYHLIFYGIPVATGALLLGVIRYYTSRRFEREQTQYIRTLIRQMLVLSLLTVVALAAVRFPQLGAADAQAVRQGRPVAAGRVGPFVVGLGPGAQPVTVYPIGETKGQAAQAVQSRSLFYMGESSGIAVLYDYDNQKVLYVPLSTVVLEVNNCRVPAPVDPICKRRV
jgi:hypothetical protein